MIFARSSLSKVRLPSDLTKISEAAFQGCTNLTEIEIPDELTEIEDDAFFRCENLEKVNLPKSLKRLGNTAFDRCSNLKEIIIPKSLEYLGRAPLANCELLEAIYYEGNTAMWESLVAQENAGLKSPFSNAIIYTYSGTKPVEAGSYWHYVDGKVTHWF